MEPEVVAFLKRIALSIFITFCWLAINTIIGIKFNLAFIDSYITIGNILFYIWMAVSFITMLIYFIHMWKNMAKW